MTTKKLPPSPNRSPIHGPKNVYRGKLKMAIAITLTPDGLRLLLAGAKATGMSRGDFVEMILRRTEHAHFASMAREEREQQLHEAAHWRANPELQSKN